MQLLPHVCTVEMVILVRDVDGVWSVAAFDDFFEELRFAGLVRIPAPWSFGKELVCQLCIAAFSG